jgi:hypothetical protein
MSIFMRIKGSYRSRVYDPSVRVGFTQFPKRPTDAEYDAHYRSRIAANIAAREERETLSAFLRPQVGPL